jgi:hypothetical protein
MSLNETGRTGADVNLTGDGVLGIVTQDPESMLHSQGPDGLLLADGNVGFGVPFSMLFYFTHSTTAAVQTTTSTPVSANSPFKFRVLSVKVRCISSLSRDFSNGFGSLRVVVEDGDGSGTWTDILPWSHVGGMESGDVREFSALNQVPATVASNEGLRCKFESKADSMGNNPTVKFLVEVQGLRVN